MVPKDMIIRIAPRRKRCTELISRFFFDGVSVWLACFGVSRIEPRRASLLCRLLERPWQGLLKFPLLVRIYDHRLNLLGDGLQILEPLFVQSLAAPSHRRTSHNKAPHDSKQHDDRRRGAKRRMSSDGHVAASLSVRRTSAR